MECKFALAIAVARLTGIFTLQLADASRTFIIVHMAIFSLNEELEEGCHLVSLGRQHQLKRKP